MKIKNYIKNLLFFLLTFLLGTHPTHAKTEVILPQNQEVFTVEQNQEVNTLKKQVQTPQFIFGLFKETGHTTLDVVGVIPGLGEPADALNGVWYILEGDATNATLSFAATAPVIGWVSTGGKWALKGALRVGKIAKEGGEFVLKYGDEIAKISDKINDLKFTDELVDALKNDLKDPAFLEEVLKNPNRIDAWEALFDLPLLRVNTTKLKAVDDFATAKNIDASLVKTELNNLPTHKEDLIKGFEISNGTTPYPQIANKGDISTTGSLHGSFQNGQFVPNSNTQPNGIMDFVALPDGQILLGTKHTFLSQGIDVLAAGTVKLNNGVVKDITNLSGHYVPTPGEGMNFLRVFKEQGVNIDNAFLSMYKADGTVFKQIAPSANVRKLYE